MYIIADCVALYYHNCNYYATYYLIGQYCLLIFIVAKQLVHTPPTLPFFEKSLTFSTRPDSSSQSRTEDYDSSISSKTRVHHSKAGWPHSNTSPPRSKAQHWPNSNTSPPRSKAQHWPDSNTSPPRSKAQHWPDSNTSPPHSNAQHWPDSNTNNPDSNTNRPDDNTSPLNYKAQHWPESNTNGPDSNTNSPHSNTNRPDDNTHFNRSQRTYSESHVSRGPMLTQLLDNNVSESLPCEYNKCTLFYVIVVGHFVINAGDMWIIGQV